MRTPPRMPIRSEDLTSNSCAADARGNSWVSGFCYASAVQDLFAARHCFTRRSGAHGCSSIGEMPPDFSQIGPFLFAALIVFAIYRRFRRSFGRQLLRPGRLIFRIVLIAAVGCSLVPMALRSAQYLWAELAGAALGIGLGLWGAGRTRLVMDGGPLHYGPPTYTGIALSLLFLGPP